MSAPLPTSGAGKHRSSANGCDGPGARTAITDGGSETYGLGSARPHTPIPAPVLAVTCCGLSPFAVIDKRNDRNSNLELKLRCLPCNFLFFYRSS